MYLFHFEQGTATYQRHLDEILNRFVSNPFFQPMIVKNMRVTEE